MRPLPDGYEIRPPTFDDVEGVAEMLLADDLADTGECASTKASGCAPSARGTCTRSAWSDTRHVS
jgi:hypothetical protein